MPVSVVQQCRHVRVDRVALARHGRAVLKACGRSRGVVDVQLVDDAAIAEINEEWRGIAAVTDVLSFALQEGEAMPGTEELLGDVVISLDTARRQAAALERAWQRSTGDAACGYGVQEEAAFLLTHGILHLLGYDHMRAAEAEVMEALERTLMAPLTAAPVHGLDRSDHAPTS